MLRLLFYLKLDRRQVKLARVSMAANAGEPIIVELRAVSSRTSDLSAIV